MNGFWALFLTIFIVGADSQNQYCQLQSCAAKKAVHTLCLYPNAGAAPACGSSKQVGLSDQDRRNIVAQHNKYRQLVASGQEKRGNPGPQPAARVMPNLVWDNEIANIAQRWANQCNYGHDKCRDTSQSQVGQNVGYVAHSNHYRDPLEIVVAWYNEVDNFDGRTVPRFKRIDSVQKPIQIGHYTQFVWGKTTKIGCGAVRYIDGPWYKTYLVCNYGPTGNYPGQPVYETK